MMTTALHLGSIGLAGLAMSALLPQTFSVRLIDRRTGLTHRINGNPLVLFTKNPDVAVAELLSGRDPTMWETRVEPISTDTHKGGGRR